MNNGRIRAGLVAVATVLSLQPVMATAGEAADAQAGVSAVQPAADNLPASDKPLTSGKAPVTEKAADSSPTADEVPEPTGQTVYKVKGKDGKVRYTATPAPASKPEAVEVIPKNIQPSQTGADTEGRGRREVREAENPSSKLPAAVLDYESIEISSPLQDETYTTEDGNFTLTAHLLPQLQEGHRVAFLLDGAVVGEPSDALSAQVTDIERGTHTVVVQVIDDGNNVLLESTPVTFHIKRHSRLQKSKTDSEENIPDAWNTGSAATTQGGTGVTGGATTAGATGVQGAPSTNGAPPKAPKPGK